MTAISVHERSISLTPAEPSRYAWTSRTIEVRVPLFFTS